MMSANCFGSLSRPGAMTVSCCSCCAPGRVRRLADLPRRRLDVLARDRAGDIARGDADRRHAHRVEPDAHRILPLPEDLRVADPRQPRDLLLQLHIGVVRDENLIVRVVRRIQIDREHEIARRGADADSLRYDFGRQQRLRELDPVLHIDLIDIRVAADRKADLQPVGARTRRGSLHVEHVGNAVDLFLDRLRDRVGDGFRAGPGIIGRHRHRGRRDVRILRDRDDPQREQPGQHDDDRNDQREFRPMDKEGTEHPAQPPFAAVCAGIWPDGVCPAEV